MRAYTEILSNSSVKIESAHRISKITLCYLHIYLINRTAVKHEFYLGFNAT